jgi:transcriptional regulator with XRE-family HTH domain
VEARRRLLKTTQQVLAEQLGMTQGHYSKLVRGRAPLGGAAEVQLKRWLARAHPAPRRRAKEIERLTGLVTLHSSALNEAVKALVEQIS